MRIALVLECRAEGWRSWPGGGGPGGWDFHLLIPCMREESLLTMRCSLPLHLLPCRVQALPAHPGQVSSQAVREGQHQSMQGRRCTAAGAPGLQRPQLKLSSQAAASITTHALCAAAARAA